MLPKVANSCKSNAEKRDCSQQLQVDDNGRKPEESSTATELQSPQTSDKINQPSTDRDRIQGGVSFKSNILYKCLSPSFWKYSNDRTQVGKNLKSSIRPNKITANALSRRAIAKILKKNVH